MEGLESSEFWAKKEKACVKKKKRGQASPLYRSGRENSLAVRLKPLTINSLEHLSVSTGDGVLNVDGKSPEV